MRTFIGLNVLVSILDKEYPLFTYSLSILSLVDNPKFTVYASPVYLVFAFYFAEKKSGTQLAKRKIVNVANKLSITDIFKNEVVPSFKTTLVNDFEDGIENYAALSAKCDTIITDDMNDFYFSSLPVLNSRSFIKKQLV